jgi:hypothetical protein
MNQPRRRLLDSQNSQKGLDDQILRHPLCHGIAYDFTCEKILVPGKIQPAFLRGNVRLSRPGDFPPQPLREPDVTLLAHPAPTTQALWHASKLPVNEKPWISLGELTQITPCPPLVAGKTFVFTSHPANQIAVNVPPNPAHLGRTDHSTLRGAHIPLNECAIALLQRHFQPAFHIKQHPPNFAMME